MQLYLNFMDKVTLLTKYLLVLIVTLMTFLVFIQVPGRYLFNSTPAYLSEIATYCLIWTAFIGSSLAFTYKKHVSLTLFIKKLKGKKAKFTIFMSNIFVLGFLVILLLSTITFAVSSWEQMSATLGFRITWPALGAPLGTLLMIMQVVRNMIDQRGS
ncbi:hypothetical protein GCM10009865_30030 [Aeromicrobium ponti]|uniref:TRAP-type C4-dicarboxylate transport system permease small subunit n=1 Tax=Cytobacillus oceanisediminis TaxID=665099 RepID=A0A562JRF9_9BACI|nr:TRAP transporter small permease subunit [Cytobacillus oceanisediminis]TWH85777.1 TRAP-type C4-dicarboxylate transport system permease small subunit [Cytobacillus oceanisediminis]